MKKILVLIFVVFGIFAYCEESNIAYRLDEYYIPPIDEYYIPPFLMEEYYIPPFLMTVYNLVAINTVYTNQASKWSNRWDLAVQYVGIDDVLLKPTWASHLFLMKKRLDERIIMDGINWSDKTLQLWVEYYTQLQLGLKRERLEK